MTAKNTLPQTIADSLSTASRDLLMDHWYDRDNWSGMPLLGGNVGFNQALKGNVTDLKKKGLITTDTEPNPAARDSGVKTLTWVTFTALGQSVAQHIEATASKNDTPDIKPTEELAAQMAEDEAAALKVEETEHAEAVEGLTKAMNDPKIRKLYDEPKAKATKSTKKVKASEVATSPIKAKATKPAKASKTPAKAKTTKTPKTKSSPTLREQLEAIKLTPKTAIDKALIKKHLGEMDDKKARKLARQLKAIRSAK